MTYREGLLEGLVKALRRQIVDLRLELVQAYVEREYVVALGKEIVKKVKKDMRRKAKAMCVSGRRTQ